MSLKDIDCEKEIDVDESGNPDVSQSIPFDMYGSDPNDSILNDSLNDSYQLVLDLPQFLKKLNLKAGKSGEKFPLDKLETNIFSVNLPSISIPSKEVPFGQGGSLKTPGTRVEPYEPLNCEFVVDSRFKNYYVMNRWLDQMSHLSDESSLTVANNVKANFAIYVLEEYKNRVARFVFEDAFPTKLSGLDLSTRNDGEPLTATVTFEYNFVKMKLLDPDLDFLG